MNCTFLCGAQAQFITTWKTNNYGISKDNQVTIPGRGSYNIAWQEVGNVQNKGTAQGKNATTITFPKVGIYRISISGGLQQLNFSYLRSDNAKLLTIEQWGNIAWTTMQGAFVDCKNLTYNATDIPDLSRVKSMSQMFYGCSVFNGDISNWDVSQVINMEGLFKKATLFNQPIGKWNTSNVVNMKEMFSGAQAFNQPIGEWNTSKVTDMSLMFSGARAFNQPIEKWNTSQVIYMQ